MSVPAYPHPIIAKEGWIFIAIFAAVSLVLTLFSPWFSLIGWLLTLFTIQFFRDPPRESGSDDELDVLCPAVKGHDKAADNSKDVFHGKIWFNIC